MKAKQSTFGRDLSQPTLQQRVKCMTDFDLVFSAKALYPKTDDTSEMIMHSILDELERRLTPTTFVEFLDRLAAEAV